jgi:hypothetical protein
LSRGRADPGPSLHDLDAADDAHSVCDWKLALIEAENPHWRDLSEEWFETPRRSVVLDAASLERGGQVRDAGSRICALCERSVRDDG